LYWREGNVEVIQHLFPSIVAKPIPPVASGINSLSPRRPKRRATAQGQLNNAFLVRRGDGFLHDLLDLFFGKDIFQSFDHAVRLRNIDACTPICDTERRESPVVYLWRVVIFDPCRNTNSLARSAKKRSRVQRASRKGRGLGTLQASRGSIPASLLSWHSPERRRPASILESG